jgi:transcriptional regulator with XRE-family HTH domain
MDIKLKVGLRIKELRLKAGLSQEKLAELAQLHRTYISSLELGQRNISIVNIERLAIALKCDLKDLFIDLNSDLE